MRVSDIIIVLHRPGLKISAPMWVPSGASYSSECTLSFFLTRSTDKGDKLGFPSNLDLLMDPKSEKYRYFGDLNIEWWEEISALSFIMSMKDESHN